MNRALFLDRDGTVLKEINDENSEKGLGYLLKPEQVSLVDGAAEAIALGRRLGFKIIIITNQSAIARGWLTEEVLTEINNKMYSMLMDVDPGAVIDDLYYSPYHTDGVIEKYMKDTEMRKPGTGMILQAQKDFDIDLSASYIIGDAYSDMKCAENSGTGKILVRTGYGETAYKKCLDEKLKIDFIAKDILDAVRWIENNYKLH